MHAEWTHYARPWTHNAERREHYMERSSIVREWRGAFIRLAQEAGRRHERFAPPVTITVTVTCRQQRGGVLPDIVACAGAFKAALDGLVQAGVLPDDGPGNITSVTFHPPTVGRRDSLTVAMDGEQRHDGGGGRVSSGVGPTPRPTAERKAARASAESAELVAATR